MTLSAAQDAAQQLRAALLDNGVQRVSIELQPGVGPKADPWGVAPFVRGLGHHIVSRPPGTPGLSLVKAGRTGANALQGPLCNGYGGFDFTARIITMGWANHPGEGGPWSVPGWGTVPQDNGRPYIFGWEFEGGIEPWTDEMHEFMARCGAGTLDWLGWLNRREAAPLECWGEHGHPWAEGRKIDRLGYTAASGRTRIAAVRGTTPSPAVQEDDDMKLIQSPGRGIAVVGPGYYKSITAEELDTAVTLFGKPNGGGAAWNDRQFDLARSIALNGVGVGSTAAQLTAAVASLSGLAAADVDEDALAAAVASKLSGSSAEEIAEALRGVLRAGVGA